jgi:excisionase family DNA binding protein
MSSYRLAGLRKDNHPTLTTGQVAKLCDVAPRTVSKWVDSGKLKGYRIPGSNDRRIIKGDLVTFMRQYHIPIPTEINSYTTVSMIGSECYNQIQELTVLLNQHNLLVDTYPSSIHAMMGVMQTRSCLVVFWPTVSADECRNFISAFRDNTDDPIAMMRVLGDDIHLDTYLDHDKFNLVVPVGTEPKVMSTHILQAISLTV